MFGIIIAICLVVFAVIGLSCLCCYDKPKKENWRIKMKELKFECPKCGSNKLGSVEDVLLTYPITKIADDGDLDYDYKNPEKGDGQVLAYQCMECGFELEDENGHSINDCIEVPKWIKKNSTEQKTK